jgi:peptidoglycan/xylan/chitin deacetylase (PgdA/CDA1 family)
VGSWIAANPRLIRAALVDGHEMANHTWSHPALRRLGRSAVASEIVKCADALRAATGSAGSWFRPSGTPTPTRLMFEEASIAGYETVVGYDVDPLDYQDPGSAKVVSRTLAGVQPGSIVSLHLGHPGTVDALHDIVLGLTDRGLRPRTVSQLFAK